MKKTAFIFLFNLISVCYSVALFSQATNKIDSVGNIGVGTTSPSDRIHIYTGPYAYYGTSGGITISDSYIVARLWDSYGGSDVGTLDLYHDGERNIRLIANGDNYLNGGKVGIGTTTPSEKLTVNGNISMSGNATERTIWNSGYGGAVQLLRSDVNSTRWARLGIVDGNGNWIDGVHVTSLANVGIGTTTPSEKLSVNGNISTKKVIVTQLGWSDYVFDKDYKLRSLDSLRAFIKDNKHLPEIPTAKEVAEKGISVGDNQALLLKKIEELTLYIIKQQRQLDKQDRKNEQQQKEIEKLKNQIKNQ